MKQIITTLFLGLLCLLTTQSFAQQRYVDEVFTDYVRTDTVVYGANYTIIVSPPVLQPLICDIYEPMGDTASVRPVVLVAPTGNFLPRPLNGGPNGTIKDSAVVEICISLAKRGYVAIPFFYRQGWDVLNPDQTIQTATLLQAAYRGIQDGRALVRFVRAHALSGNTYKFDTTRIAMAGIGTGGYVSLGAAFLDDFEKVKLPKFTDFNTGMVLVDTTRDGNIYGTTTKPLCNPNHLGHSSDFNVAVNIGGALGDSSWIDPGDMPVIAFHTPLDANAPYDIGVVIVPTTGNTVIDEAAGSLAVLRASNEFGNNAVFAGLNDPYSMAANAAQKLTTPGEASTYEGLFPFNRPLAPGGTYDCFGTPLPLSPEGDPWNWWDEAAFIADWNAAVGSPPGVQVNCNQRRSNPDMSAAKGRMYIDSIMNYMSIRLALAMDVTPTATAIDDDQLRQNLSVYPNPASRQIHILNHDAVNPIREIRLMDMTGRTVQLVSGLRVTEYTLDRQQLTPGIYLVQIRADKGITTAKVVLE